MSAPVTTPLPPVLITDDSGDDVFFLKRSLTKSGVQNPVLTFANGELLINFLEGLAAEVGAGRTMRPSILFLDIKMPGTNGFEVLEWVRDHPSIMQGMKVVMHSSSNEAIDVERARRLGADHYIQKMASVPTLQEIWRQFIR